MKDSDCVQFLQWVLPQLHMRWPGFQKVRKQVCRRLDLRLKVLQLANIDAYRRYLESHLDEWPILDGLCYITISRFYREKAVFLFIEQQVLPALIQSVIHRNNRQLRVLCLGSASGEEPYTIAIIWRLLFQAQYPDIALKIVAIDSSAELVQRSQLACYPYSSIKNLPKDWQQNAFHYRDNTYCLKPVFADNVQFLKQDVRESIPDGPYDLILCRNLVFTYFNESLQTQILERISQVLHDHGVLVIGIHEYLPKQQNIFNAWSERLRIFVKNQ